MIAVEDHNKEAAIYANTQDNSPLTGSGKSNRSNIYDEVDAIFFENIVEYTENPCKLITKLKTKYKDEFKDWKYLHKNHVDQGDLVRIRGMILSGLQFVFSLNSVITEEEDGSTRTNIKEIKGMTRRNAFILVPERGITDWYSNAFHGESQKSLEMLLKNEEFRVHALFYDDGSEHFKPNIVLDLYGIVDLTEMTVEEDDYDLNAKSSSNIMSLHVIHYELVEHHSIVSSAHPEVLTDRNMRGFELLVCAFEQFFCNKVVAQLLICHLFISRHSQLSKSRECIFPYTIKNVRDSKPLVEMIKLFMPKVHVIKMVQETIEESWSSYERAESGFEQGLLQVSDNTLVIIDETKLSPENLLLTDKGRKNCQLITNFLSARKISFIYPYQTVEIESSANVLVLSGEKCFLGQNDFAMVLSKSSSKGIDFVRQYAIEHESDLNLCRHTLLSCPRKFSDIGICQTVEEIAVESFLEMQRICRNAADNSARLHRQLIISKNDYADEQNRKENIGEICWEARNLSFVWLLAALKDEETVDEDCWKKAVEFEKSVSRFTEAL
uniref:Mini-chromosome maintenance complex-binding protein n=1 Tax=Setaria digitata TaxID=48799 RepID=A0A915Q8E3_9BILA